MLRAALLVAPMVVAAIPAHAERQSMATAKLAIGAAANADSGADSEPDRMTGFGLQLSWEDPAPAYPAEPGYATRFQLVPELQVMRLSFARGGNDELVDTASAITGGVRLQLALAQKEQGLLRVSARGTFFLGIRTGFVSDVDRTRVTGGTLGERICIGDRYQLGLEVDVLRFRGEQQRFDFPPPGDGLRTPPWAPSDASYTALGLAITLGGFL